MAVDIGQGFGKTILKIISQIKKKLKPENLSKPQSTTKIGEKNEMNEKEKILWYIQTELNTHQLKAPAYDENVLLVLSPYDCDQIRDNIERSINGFSPDKIFGVPIRINGRFGHPKVFTYDEWDNFDLHRVTIDWSDLLNHSNTWTQYLINDTESTYNTYSTTATSNTTANTHTLRF